MEKVLDKGQEAVRISAGWLTTQISFRGGNLKEAGIKICGDRFARGYVFGFVDAALQHVGVTEEVSALALIAMAHLCLFGDDLGGRMIGLSLKDQRDEVFLNGRTKGANEILAFINGKSTQTPPPFGLFDHLGTF